MTRFLSSGLSELHMCNLKRIENGSPLTWSGRNRRAVFLYIGLTIDAGAALVPALFFFSPASLLNYGRLLLMILCMLEIARLCQGCVILTPARNGFLTLRSNILQKQRRSTQDVPVPRRVVSSAILQPKPKVRWERNVTTKRRKECLVLWSLHGNAAVKFVMLTRLVELSPSSRFDKGCFDCPSCVHPSTRQKLHRSSDISLDIAPASEGVRITPEGVQVEWAGGHTSFYPSSFLERYTSPDRLSAFHKDVIKQSWDAKSATQSPDLFLSYDSFHSDPGLLKAITQLSKYGLFFLTGVPNTETSNEACEVRKLTERLGELRSTFYGETWDVKNIVNSRNIAYTNLYLGLHMDILYFEHPPRYQILHCIRNRVKGGTSLFVDALHAANTLRETDPSSFSILTSTPVNFHYINDGHHLHRSHPTIELSPFSKREIAYVNYSPPFQAPLPPDTLPEFCTALGRFAGLLEDPRARFEYRLKEGDAVLFDNRRVLHARTAFSEVEGEVEGEDKTNRWLKGCYFEGDRMEDRGRILREKLEGGAP
ncbi:hypothetical protein EW146_g3533 [Bondarzewia mesenterica]|uniref:TauD/TfdA-like domain-containing protein n=1 Tax=Bondarzewia mesenterica TaxID=1095465 RepID=A0A4S4LX85_9AGAM|nr:hypothetical protein EW146_g3533 [Bondarzewia mesenterica]